MEYEVRFYFSKNKLEKIFDLLDNEENLILDKKYYEKTFQFDHPCEEMSFYDKKIDGRFRLRLSKSDNDSKCKLSWKRRLPNHGENDINKEEEVELFINYDEHKNLLFLIDNVLKMKTIESYERYRTIYYNDEIEISVDEYPFGVALEIEYKGTKGSPEIVIKKWLSILDLEIENSYKLSWDDKYLELCKEQNIEVYSHVLFNLPMPMIRE